MTSVEDPAVARMAATGEGDRRGGSEAGLPTGTAAAPGSVDVYRRAAAERSDQSLRSFVHGAAVAAASEHRHRVAEAARLVAERSAELNRRLADE